MTINPTFTPPEFWYVKKDTDSILWPCFQVWFFKQSDDKYGIKDCPYEYYTHDPDGFFILPNQPKNVKEVSLKQWYHWYFFAEMREKKIQIPDDALLIHPPGIDKSSLKVEYTLDGERKTMVLNESSILEKLREWIEKKQAKIGAQEYSLYGKGQLMILSDVKRLLTSLEQSQTKEEPQTLGIDYGIEGGDKGMEVKGYKNDDGTMTITSCEEQWTPTPGQMIEVSYDGEKWEEEKYTFMRMKGNYYECTNGSIWYVWKYARPLTEEVIVPEYTAPQMYADGGRHKVGGPTAEQKQLESITNWIHTNYSNSKPQ